MCYFRKWPGNVPVKGLNLATRINASFAIAEDRQDGPESCQSSS